MLMDRQLDRSLLLKKKKFELTFQRRWNIIHLSPSLYFYDHNICVFITGSKNQNLYLPQAVSILINNNLSTLFQNGYNFNLGHSIHNNCSLLSGKDIIVTQKKKKKKVKTLYWFLMQGNINECPKDISLGITFRNILQENNKVINFSDNFLYFS